MDKHSGRTLHARTLSLLPLESALIAAEKLTPSRAPQPTIDSNELLAVQLIERIKHSRPMLLPGLKIESPQPVFDDATLEMAGCHV